MKSGKKSAQPHSHKELQIRKHIIMLMIKSINKLNAINDSIVYKFVSNKEKNWYLIFNLASEKKDAENHIG